jgi:hypothetical protein
MFVTVFVPVTVRDLDASKAVHDTVRVDVTILDAEKDRVRVVSFVRVNVSWPVFVNVGVATRVSVCVSFLVTVISVVGEG